MKNFVRIMALVLACMTCLLCFVACDDGDKGKGNYEVDLRVDENGVKWAADEWGYYRQYDNLPFDLDYEQEVINCLVWDPDMAEFAQTEEVDDARLSSIYKRNEAVQARLNVELNFITEHSAAGEGIKSFTQRVQRAKEAGTNDFDIIATYSRTQGALLLQGLLQDLNAIEGNYFEQFSSPWWPNGLAGQMNIRDSLYFVSGDISITAIDEMHSIFFNKDLIDERFEETAKAAGDYESATEWLYQMVYDGKWTVDQFFEMASGYYADNTRNGISVDDNYGICSVYYCISSLYGSCNLKQIEPDTNKVLVISGDVKSVRTTRLYAKLTELMKTNDYHDGTRPNSGSYTAPFTKGNALFYLGYMCFAEKNLISNDAVENYGILPLPKYDSAQTNYYTVVGNAFSIFSIFVDCDDRGSEAETLKMLSAVLECWASEAYRKTTPVVFELNMQLKYSPTQDETNMCEYIRAGIMFDLGRVLDSAMGGGAGDVINIDNLVVWGAQDGTAWTTQYAKYLPSMEKNLEDFVKSLGYDV